MTIAHRALQYALEAITIALLVVLAIIVVLAVIFRFSGSSFVWYDEVASVMLAWITYYGAALACLRRAHLGFAGLVLSRNRPVRVALFVIAEAVVYGVFLTMAWASWDVLAVMAGETLVSLDWVPLQFTQSVVPIGCVLFVLCQAMSTGSAWTQTMAGKSQEDVEIEQEIAHAQGKERSQ